MMGTAECFSLFCLALHKFCQSHKQKFSLVVEISCVNCFAYLYFLLFNVYSTTRFKWIQDSPDAEAPSWALDDIYVGEMCPSMCHGRGDCKGGHCHCDDGYKGQYGWFMVLHVDYCIQ